MQNINVNIVPDSYPQTIRYSQGDVGREFKINVVGFTIPTGATVKIQATKPSGFGFSVAGTVVGNAVSFTTTAIMTDEAGRFPAELEITKDSVVIGTANFIMWGEANPHPEGTTDGQQGTIIPELTLLVERVEAAASSVLDMQVVAETLAAGSQATYSYDEDLNKATFGIPQGEAGAGAAGVVASAYSASATYKVGDYVIHNSNLYRCTTAITTAEAFTAAHWTQIVLADDVSDLKSDLGDIRTQITYKSSNLLNLNDPDFATGKYVDPDHGWLNTNALYNTSGFIPVEAGQILHLGYDTTPTTYRTISFICPYDATKTAIQNSGASNVSSYTVPSGAKYVRFTASSYYMQASLKPIFYSGSITEYEEYYPPYTVTKIKNNTLDVAKIPFGHMYRFDLGSDETFTGTIDTQAIQGYTVSFRGNISGAFKGILVGRGVWATYGFGVEITALAVNIYTDTNSTPTYTYAHGLTIKDYIGVTFNFKNFRPSVEVETNGGKYLKTDIPIDPKKGVLSAISDDTVFTDCTLSYFCQYYEKRNYLYGDSYFSIDPTRWTHYLYEAGIKCMLNAYPGRNSVTALEQLKQDLLYGGCPKRVVWCMGMNDEDDGAVNSSWKTCVDWLIDNHEYYGFDLILATIPNTPEVDNSYKNAYVEASGFRYIDFARAVGAHDGTTWYEGMLSDDDVHPLTQGGIALYSQAISDLPELFSDQA